MLLHKCSNTAHAVPCCSPSTNHRVSPTDHIHAHGTLHIRSQLPIGIPHFSTCAELTLMRSAN
eukprot:m.43851 g.43851  ORF g.43851 m.43851 type:complete len:63 (+) comp8472_c0_seq1:145-333(+)